MIALLVLFTIILLVLCAFIYFLIRVFRFLNDIPQTKMKFELHKGLCEVRWTCKNVNKSFCKSIPKDNDDFVECEHYKEAFLYDTK